jgi:hypothetical protein
MMAADGITVVVAQQPAVPMQAAGTEAMNMRTTQPGGERMELPIL